MATKQDVVCSLVMEENFGGKKKNSCQERCGMLTGKILL